MQSQPARCMPFSDTDPSSNDAAVAALLRRVAAAAGVHMYEMELLDEAIRLPCLDRPGAGGLLGGVPGGVDEEEAWEALYPPRRPRGLRGSFPPLRSGERDRDGVPAGRLRRRHPLGLGAMRPQARRPTAGCWLTASSPTSPIATGSRSAGGAHDRLAHLAYHDHLTGLANRVQFAGAPRPGTCPRAPRRLGGGGAVHRPGRVQAHQRWARACRRRRGAAGGRAAAVGVHPRGRCGGPAGRRRVPDAGPAGGRRRCRRGAGAVRSRARGAGTDDRRRRRPAAGGRQRRLRAVPAPGGDRRAS